MAELTELHDDPATSICCAAEQQADCCEPTDEAYGLDTTDKMLTRRGFEPN